MSIHEKARSYHASGLCVLPAILAQKRPAVSAWKTFQTRQPSEYEVDRWFGPHSALCLVAGAISGNLEMLDFDLGGDRRTQTATIRQ